MKYRPLDLPAASIYEHFPLERSPFKENCYELYKQLLAKLCDGHFAHEVDEKLPIYKGYERRYPTLEESCDIED